MRLYRMSSQTTLHQFFKIKSNKNSGLQEKKLSQKDSDKENEANKRKTSSKSSNLRKKKAPVKSNFVESEVQVLQVGTPSGNTNKKSKSSRKRATPSELECTSKKKAKIDPLTPNNDANSPLSSISDTSPIRHTHHDDANLSSTSDTLPLSQNTQTPNDASLSPISDKSSLSQNTQSPNDASLSPISDTSPLSQNTQTSNDASLSPISDTSPSSQNTQTSSDASLSPISNTSPSSQNTQTSSDASLSPISNTSPSSRNTQTSNESTQSSSRNNSEAPEGNSTSNFAEEKSITPKQQTSRRNKSSSSKKISPRKQFFANGMNVDTVLQAVENLNLVKQGSIILNEFDYELVFQNSEFSYVYNEGTEIPVNKFEIKDINFPKDKQVEHLMMIIAEVFSKPLNCGYYLMCELHQIFQLFTLSTEAQMLFVKFLKEKVKWHRVNNAKYQIFEELVYYGFCKLSDLYLVDTSTLLRMLQVNEIRHICQTLVIDSKGKKTDLIKRLEDYGSSEVPLFVGAKTPKEILRNHILSTLRCVSLTEEIVNLFESVVVLFDLILDPSETITDLFLILKTVHGGNLPYPDDLKIESFPMFKNRSHFFDYVKGKNAYKRLLAFINGK